MARYPTEASEVVETLSEGDIVEIDQYEHALEVNFTGDLNGQTNAMIGIEFADDAQKTDAQKTLMVNQNSNRVYLTVGSSSKSEVKTIKLRENDDDQDNDQDNDGIAATDGEREEVAADGGQDVQHSDGNENETDSNSIDLPVNETVRLITGINGLMHTPEIIEGKTSSTGITISVTAPHRETSHRLNTEDILAGESEYRDSRYYMLYTPERFTRRQRSNRAPGPQAGVNEISELDELPPATHELPNEIFEKENLATEREEEEDTGGNDQPVTDKWDLSQYRNGDQLILDRYSGKYVIVRKKTDPFGTVLALWVVGPENELLKLRKTGEMFCVRKGVVEGGRPKEIGGPSAVVSTSEMDNIHDFKHVGHNDQRRQRWVRNMIRDH